MKKAVRPERQIGVRELARDTKRILEEARRGRSFIIAVHGKPTARITPLEEPKKYTYSDFLALAGTANIKEKDISQRVDEIVYGNM